MAAVTSASFFKNSTLFLAPTAPTAPTLVTSDHICRTKAAIGHRRP
ncbi:hypothetical protein [Paenibacillus sp. FSL H3-0310]